MGCGVFQISNEVNCVLLWDFEHGVSHFIWFMAIVCCVMLKRNETLHFRDITGSCPKVKNKVKTYPVGFNSQSYSDHWACRYRIAVPNRSSWQGLSVPTWGWEPILSLKYGIFIVSNKKNEQIPRPKLFQKICLSIRTHCHPVRMQMVM